MYDRWEWDLLDGEPWHLKLMLLAALFIVFFLLFN